METVIVDPGHGGTEPAGKSSPIGARGSAGTLEKDVTLQIADRLSSHLGPGVVLTRVDDRNLSLSARARAAHDARAAVFVSIHANSGAPGARGPQAFVHTRASPASRALAERIQYALEPAAGRGVTAAELAVLSPEHHASATAACLVEVDFLSDPQGEADLTDPVRIDEIAAAMAGAVRVHLRELAGSTPGTATYGGRAAAPRRQAGAHERYGRGVAAVRARTLAPITPDYAATTFPQAVRLFAEWLRDRIAFTVGVGDTAFFPHSAICRLDLYSGDAHQGHGTGFYIAPDRILTAGHVLWGMDAVEVSPGRNGDRDLGGFSLANDRGQFVVHPSYGGSNSDFDLAVLKVPASAPNGECFGRIEELRMSPGSGVIVCGYAAGEVDSTRQHLDVDTIRDLFDETFTYALETRGGTSGSPVWYVDGSALVVVGVHISGFDSHHNRGCRLTDAKVAWIRSV